MNVTSELLLQHNVDVALAERPMYCRVIIVLRKSPVSHVRK